MGQRENKMDKEMRSRSREEKRDREVGQGSRGDEVGHPNPTCINLNRP